MTDEMDIVKGLENLKATCYRDGWRNALIHIRDTLDAEILSAPDSSTRLPEVKPRVRHRKHRTGYKHVNWRRVFGVPLRNRIYDLFNRGISKESTLNILRDELLVRHNQGLDMGVSMSKLNDLLDRETSSRYSEMLKLRPQVVLWGPPS